MRPPIILGGGMMMRPEAVEARYPVICSYCGAVKGLSTVKNSHGVCRPCFERVWDHFVGTHPPAEQRHEINNVSGGPGQAAA